MEQLSPAQTAEVELVIQALYRYWEDNLVWNFNWFNVPFFFMTNSQHEICARVNDVLWNLETGEVSTL